ncbi:MAG: GlsB/YeaQ/YmgE family stress response membrane protein [Lachnospiraceae bacterium]|nr:GlsB/YeaQ/YmgE family stress response membrane protein [Lachnospiraceae bacterium]MBO4669724.1 GlsB/YeaQ/YmgE family stress response membrane protein [Lachnospiraceae bacterium]MBR5667748.1 GlsB/YeaQ/YmgE family stress response membrane protein [Lachnospiraceae bacterium]
MGWVVTIIVGGICGWLAGAIMDSKKNGLLINIILGIIGGALGNFVFGLIGIHFFGLVGNIIGGVIGTCLLIAIGRLIFKK